MSVRQPGSEEPAGADGPTTATTEDPGDAFVLGRDGQREPARPPAKGKHKEDGFLAFLRELPVLMVLAFGLAILLKTFVVQAFYIPSGSMEPTLMPGDRVLVEKVLYHPQRGDIIVFQNPHPGAQPDRGVVGGFFHWLSEGLGFARPVDEDFIKRVIGMPGDTVEIRNHTVYINGKPLGEPYLTGPAKASMADYGPTQVPANALFVMGDNRGNSNDSRAGLGFVPLDKVVGKAFVIIWPLSRIGWLH